MRKTKTKSGDGSTKNPNYFHPLQTLNEERNSEDDDEVIVHKTAKVHVPPITILKCNAKQIHDVCKEANVNDYAVRKISIGHKLFCDLKEDFERICKQLGNRFEYFTYATKNERPYKALLLGLDKMETSIVKANLIEMGLKCLDVKLIHKTREDKNDLTIYVVYFIRQSISLSELRQRHNNINRTRVKWEYQRASSNKVTQCYNCQMFGHGSSRCNVKTFCAICSGNHKTEGCTSQTIKCVNCNGPHKALSPECPSRQSYCQMKKRFQPVKTRVQASHCNETNYNANFPNTLNQEQAGTSYSWSRPAQNDNNLFSFEEIKTIALELMAKLRSCRSKEDQFEVITTLACKFLSK